MKVLVLGAGGPAGVNFLKSLSLNPNMELYGADINKGNLNFAKPFCKDLIHLHHEDWNRMVQLDKFIEKNKIDFIHAQPDPEVQWLAYNSNSLSPRIFLPTGSTIFGIQNKKWCAKKWAKNGFNLIMPFPIEEKNLMSNLYEIFSYCEEVWIRASRGAGGKASLHPESIEEAYHWCKFWFEHDPDVELIAQEYLPGRNFGWMSIWKDGELIVSQGRERLQYIYPGLTVSHITGTPVIARTVNLDLLNRVAENAIKIIDPIPHGIYCVDVKEGRSRDFYPTEINIGRFFTTSYFFAWAGLQYGVPRANFPNIYVKLGMDEEIPEGKKYNLLPPDLYWIRHIDSPARLLEREDLV